MKILHILAFTLLTATVYSQSPLFKFGNETEFIDLIESKKNKSEAIEWYQVNTEKETWHLDGENLICSGHPIGVIRSGKKYRNFIMHIEWRHMEAGGNSGTFVWSDALTDQEKILPAGVEVQMLELDWVNLNTRDGVKPPIAYVHGEIFGVGGVECIPDNPRGRRSKSVENRCKGKGEWNTYDVICVDGTIKLSVNGKFVNGISKSTSREGYICLESEGAEIQFRNMKITVLPD